MSRLIIAAAITVMASLPHLHSKADQSADLVTGGDPCTGQTAWVDCWGWGCGGYDNFIQQAEMENTVIPNPDGSTHVCSGNGWCESKWDHIGVGGCERNFD
jgi:pyruvate/2-oxoacid:ferredoxin oxidoreductase beta subunit